MKQRTIEVATTSTATPERLFAVMADTAGWVTWSRASEAEREGDGDLDLEGVGAKRRFRVGRTTSHEEVVAYEPPHRFAYVLVSGMPLGGYRADVTFEPSEDGTLVRWHSTFTVTRRGAGWIYEMALRSFLRDTANRLARAAEVSPRLTAG